MSNRYRSDKVYSEVVMRFTAVSGAASLFFVAAPLGFFVVSNNVFNCGYTGYKWAILMVCCVHLLAWAIMALGMVATFNMLARNMDTPPTPPTKRGNIRYIPRSVGGDEVDPLAIYDDD